MFIFGKGTPDTYESLQAKRAMAMRAGMAASQAPQNVGQGLSAIGQALVYRKLMKDANAGDAAGRAKFEQQFGGLFNPMTTPAPAPMSGPISGPTPITDPNSPEGIGADTMSALGKGYAFDTSGVSDAALGAWSKLTNAWGKPLKVNSAYRDPDHNAKVGGAKNSQHTHGNAFDVDVSGMSEADRLALIDAAKAAGFRGIGVYDNALHFDVGPARAWGPSYRADSIPAWAANHVLGGQGGQPGGMDLGQIVQLMSDPYAREGERMALSELFKQQLQSLNPTQSAAPAGFQELEMRARAAGLVPGSPEYQQFMLSGGGGLKEGTPAAFQALELQAEAAGLKKGTPEYQQFMLTKGAGDAAYARAVGQSTGEAAQNLKGLDSTVRMVNDQIDAVLNDPALASMVGPIQGRLPNVSADAQRFQSRLNQLQGQAFLQAYNMLRGGGQITEVEGKKAEDAMARLNTAQSEEDFRQALEDFRSAVQAGVEKLRSQAGVTAPSNDLTPEERQYLGLP